MVSGVDDGVAERVSGSQDDGSGDRLILEHGGGGSDNGLQLLDSAPESSLSSQVSGVGICRPECPALSTSAVTSVQFEVSYAFFPPIHSSDVAVAIAPTQGVNYQAAEACYASSLGRGERTGGIDVGRERTRAMHQLVASGDGVADQNILEGDQMIPQEEGGPLSDILTGRRELDMVMGQADREDGSLRWLQALDLQVLGACRSDERLNPLLRWSVPCLGSDGQLLAHLGQVLAGINDSVANTLPVLLCGRCGSLLLGVCGWNAITSNWDRQETHFKLRELGQLARCLCAPLVSVRVGKVLRHGCTLRPTATRGYLSLTMLPSSELRLSHVGDNGVLERLAVMGASSNAVSITLEELVADSSGRTFVLKLPGKLTYFWQSEKSKARGGELIAKMKDLLKQQPTLAELTGIQDSRLDLLASYVRSAISSAPTQLSNSLPQSTDSVAGDGFPRQPYANQSSIPSSSSTQIPWHHMSHMSMLQLGASRQQPGGIASSSSSLLHSGPAWNSSALASLNSRCMPSVMGRPRCSDPVCSSGTCITSASSVSVGYSTSNLRNTLDVGSMQNSWSTRTSIWSNQEDDIGVPTSHSAGLYTSLQHIPCAQGDEGGGGDVSWSPSVSVTHGFLDLQVESSAGNALPLSTFFPSMSPCTIPPPSPYIPLSTSFLAPYYCPCPLSTSGLHYSFAPSHLPAAVRESSFAQPSTSLVSVLPPLLPQSFSMTLAAHQSSVTSLPPAAISDSMSHIPVLSFISNPSWTMSHSNCSTGFSSVPSQLAVSSEGQQFSTVSLLRSLQASWGNTRQPPASGSTLTVEQPDDALLSSQERTEVVEKLCWHQSAVITRSTGVESGLSTILSGAACSRVGSPEQNRHPGHLSAIANSKVGSPMQSTDSDTSTRATLQVSQAGPQAISHLSSQVTCTKISSTCAGADGEVTAPCNGTVEVYRLTVDDNPFVAEPES